MICTNCGAEMPDHNCFCGHCGARQSAPAPQPVPVPPPVSPEPQPVPQPVAAYEPIYTAAPQPAPVYTPTPEPQPARKKGRKGLMIGIIAAVAAVLLIGGLIAWFMLSDRQKDDADSSASSTPSQTVPSAQTAPSDPTDPADPVVEVELVVNEAQLEYVLTDADVEEFYELLATGEEMALAGEDLDAIEQIMEELDEKYMYLEAQHSVSMVLYYCDLEDEEASERFLSCTETVTQANNDYLEMVRRIYLSDSPAKDMLFEDWTEEELAMLMAYTEEVMHLQQRNSEIEVAYQDLQNDPDMYDAMVPLYVEMVQNNNRIAQIYGYDNYYEYAYALVYDRDYGAEEIAKMRTYTAQYLPAALEGSMTQFIESMSDLSSTKQRKLSSFLYDSYDSGYESYITGYLATMPEQMRTDMLRMFDGNILLMNTASGAMEGAFTTTIGEDRSICFFGPGYDSAMTIVHEVGHYYGSQYSDLNSIPLDLAETQSQGNEWLFRSYLKNEMSSDLHQTLVEYEMYSNMSLILICVIVDEFEERVYTHPNVASLTSADLDAIMEEVCEAYGGTDYLASVVTDIQTYWRMVVVEQPVYYISYGVSAIAAMDIYTVAEGDYDAAVEIYRKLNEEMDIEKGFLGNITDAGLLGPFDETVYKSLYTKFAE